jgi:two-component system, chemotaxis family, protein-glutamate methylesterase/glutaminase
VSATTPAQTRVLVVDDTPSVRNLVKIILGADPDFTVVGEAADGAQAIQMTQRLRPDAVVLDIAMPVLDGIEALPHLQAINPGCNIVLFSAEDSTSQRITHLLRTTKAEFVSKPRGARDAKDAADRLRRTLLPRLRHRSGLASRPQVPKAASLLPNTAPRIDLVVVGASTGGPAALKTVLDALPAKLPVPVLVVQHIDDKFSVHLAALLQGQCQLDVVQAEHGQRPEAGRAYLARGGQHMGTVLRDGGVSLELHRGPRVHSCRPSLDVLLHATAESHGAHQLAVVLTGMGEDGLDGVRALKALGAPALVQDQATSAVWGMPGAVANAGLADEVVPLPDIAARIVGWVDASRASAPQMASAT